MAPNEHLPDDLHAIDAALRELRPDVTGNDLDRLAHRIRVRRVRGPRLRVLLASRRPGLIGAVLSAAVLMCGAAGALALTGSFSSTQSSGGAQYKAPAILGGGGGGGKRSCIKSKGTHVCAARYARCRTKHHRARK